MKNILRTTSAVLATLFLAHAQAQAPAAQPAPPSGSSPARAGSVLKTLALIIGEPNYSIDGAYQELEEGLYTQPELTQGERVFAPIGAIILDLGGEVVIDAASQSARYTLNGRSIELKAGDSSALVDGKAVSADIAPQWRNGALWVSVYWVFDQFGAYSKWDKVRQRFTASLVLPAGAKAAGVAKGGAVTEGNLDKQDAAFWASADGLKVARVIIGYQNPDGGWPKLDRNDSLTVPVNRAALTGFKAKSTIDNDATTKQIKALAAAYQAHPQEDIRASIERGLDYLLAAQLPSGGWQQFWPAPQGYKSHITFNDDAMANVLEVLLGVARLRGDFAFVSQRHAQRAQAAYDTGLALILQTQIRVGGKLTGWCAQYDKDSLQPAMGRAFELPSISGGESVNVLRFLMSLESPSPAVVQAIQSGVAWLDAARIKGLKRARRDDRTLEYGFDFVLEQGKPEDTMWARFYDLKNGKPLFSARDSQPRSRFEEVSYERRVKYNWYTTEAADLLKTDYPAWLASNNLKTALGKRP